MKPISHTGFTFGIIGSWIDIAFVLFLIYFAIKLFKSSRVLPYFYLLFP
jgi:hypothetical protein